MTKLFPLIKTNKLTETKKFYTSLGWGVTMETPGYLQVHYGSKEGPELCFMPPEDHEIQALQHIFQGQGLGFSIQVDNADEECNRLQKRGVKIMANPENKPWGWRSFLVQDPNGVVLDFYHLVPASPEFLEMMNQ